MMYIIVLYKASDSPLHTECVMWFSYALYANWLCIKGFTVHRKDRIAKQRASWRLSTICWIVILCHIRSRKYDMPGDPMWSGISLHYYKWTRGWVGVGRMGGVSHFVPLLIHRKSVISSIAVYPPLAHKELNSFNLQAETDNPPYFTLD